MSTQLTCISIIIIIILYAHVNRLNTFADSSRALNQPWAMKGFSWAFTDGGPKIELA